MVERPKMARDKRLPLHAGLGSHLSLARTSPLLHTVSATGVSFRVPSGTADPFSMTSDRHAYAESSMQMVLPTSRTHQTQRTSTHGTSPLLISANMVIGDRGETFLWCLIRLYTVLRRMSTSFCVVIFESSCFSAFRWEVKMRVSRV